HQVEPATPRSHQPKANHSFPLQSEPVSSSPLRYTYPPISAYNRQLCHLHSYLKYTLRIQRQHSRLYLHNHPGYPEHPPKLEREYRTPRKYYRSPAVPRPLPPPSTPQYFLSRHRREPPSLPQ